MYTGVGGVVVLEEEGNLAGLISDACVGDAVFGKW